MAKKKDYVGQAGNFLKSANKKRTTILSEQQEATVPMGYELRPEKKSKRLNLLIKPSIYKALKAKADAQNTSVNDIINKLIESEVSQ